MTDIYLVLDGTKTLSKEEFLKEVATLLKFPDYFGNNWDALNNCLKDIKDFWKDELIDEKTKLYLIWYNPISFSKENEEDFYMALRILRDFNNDISNPLTVILGATVDNINDKTF